MDEPDHHREVCTYHLVDDRVHVFTFHNSTQASVKAYIRLWEQNLPYFWRHSEHFDSILRMLLIYKSTESPPFGYIYQQSRALLDQFQDLPQGRIAYLTPPIANFIKGVQTYADLTDQTDIVTRRFFFTDEYDEALKWVMEHV